MPRKKVAKNTKKNGKTLTQGRKGGKNSRITSYEEYLEAYYLGEPLDTRDKTQN